MFIEEPEAHTHPQMQYVFIDKIKKTLQEINSGRVTKDDFLKVGCDIEQLFEGLFNKGIINEEGVIIGDGEKLEPDFMGFDGKSIEFIKSILIPPNNLQTFISTHSAHIVKNCDFEDIRYFLKKDTINNVEIKNFYDALEEKYRSADPKKDRAEKAHFKFLKQYLTLGSSELFFAEKIIFIEGTSEKLLFPYFMKKFDEEYSSEDSEYVSLSSQNISILEVGANAKAFRHFLDFLGIKTLIITDIDITKKRVDEKGKTTYPACCVKEGTHTSNYTLKYYLQAPDIKKEKEFKEWMDKLKANVLQGCSPVIKLSYQIEENNYHGRSFEDAFISINIDKIKDKIASFTLTQQSFNKLKNKKIPDNILEGLKTIKDQEFSGESKFLNAVEKQIEKEQTVRYKELILKHAEKRDNIDGLQNKNDLNSYSGFYTLTERILKENDKSDFASSLLFLALSEDDVEWNIPRYIKEGLAWIAK